MRNRKTELETKCRSLVELLEELSVLKKRSDRRIVRDCLRPGNKHNKWLEEFAIYNIEYLWKEADEELKNRKGND